MGMEKGIYLFFVFFGVFNILVLIFFRCFLIVIFMVFRRSLGIRWFVSSFLEKKGRGKEKAVGMSIVDFI